MSRKTNLMKLPLLTVGDSVAAWMPVSYLVFVFLLGGGARSDLASLPLLRGASLLIAFWAATRLGRGDWRSIRVPLALMMALIVWMIIQLIPLPPTLWHSLPGRETIVAIDALVGEADIWRPVTLTPSMTLNSLLAMTVPLAALLLAAGMTVEDRSRVLLALVGIACVSALLGLLQILTGPAGGAYLYRITNVGAIVGLFANRNHHAIFLACSILFVAALLRDELMRKKKRPLLRNLLVIAGIFLTVMTAVVGSRAGLGAGVIAFAIGYAMVAITWKEQLPSIRSGSPKSRRIGNTLLYAPPFLFALVLSAMLWLSDRTTALNRVIDQDAAGDLRVQSWPTVRAMIETYWQVGSGIGSFAEVYKMFEPDALLQPSYFNHAHNDWIEVLLTGGLPFAVIIILGIVWLARTAFSDGPRNLVKGARGDVRLTALATIGLLALASFVDYPLRVPSIAVMAMMMIVFVQRPRAIAR